ncbi:MAG: monofunctional biosynthetic peptidoglycan transglycosylase [Elusimicrobia bacterium]|nr:monofunctional biosynthetic peptidoglycan transglycosylase [Elusimicrobiota bacterium]
MRRSRKRWTLVRFLSLGCLALAGVSISYLLWLPDVTPLKKSNPKTTCYVELRRAQAAKAGKKFQLRMQWLPWSRISEHLKHSVFIAEDDMFYRHDGVDWDAVRTAFARDWEEKRLVYGGSTITQQVARNLYLSPSKNPLRKVKEVLIAYRLEKVLGKRRIFELYLNIAEWGKGIFGAEAAAQAYFGKSAGDLTVDEAVAMAVVLPNPKRWSPAKRGRYVERNMRRIMGRMKASGYLPDEEGETVLPEELSVSTQTAPGEGLPSAGSPLPPADEAPKAGFGSLSSEESFPPGAR